MAGEETNSQAGAVTTLIAEPNAESVAGSATSSAFSSAATDSAAKRVRVEEIMALVRARAAVDATLNDAARTANKTMALATALAALPVASISPTQDEELSRSLRQARLLSGQLYVEYKLGWRTPIIGHIWREVRRRIHQEIRIFIDALIKQQTSFNQSVVQVLTRIVDRLAQTPSSAEVAELRLEVAELRVSVSRLSAEIVSSRTGMAPAWATANDEAPEAESHLDQVSPDR